MTEQLTGLLQQALSGDSLNELSKITGADKEKTAEASQTAITTLLTALGKNAQSEEGAKKLDQALANDHDGSILENLTGFLSGSAQVNDRAANGSGILNHVLGGKKPQVEEMLAKQTGINKSSASSLLAKLAPIVMGALGKQRQQQGGFDLGSIASMLMGSAQKQSSGNATIDLISSFLDKDNDGSMIDDVAGMLGGFFRK